MPYIKDTAGLTGVNYRAEPHIWRIKGLKCPPDRIYTCPEAGDPATPLLEAHVGDLVKVHVLVPFSEQNGVFAFEGHTFPLEPAMQGSENLSSIQFGGTEALDLLVRAGGSARLAADYIWMNHRMAYMEAGQWGIFRVLPAGDRQILSLGPGPKGGDREAGVTGDGLRSEEWRP
jgi:hypothetical protein